MWKFHFRLIVNTSAGPVGFKILNNLLTGNRDAKLSFIQAKIIQESNSQNLDSEIGKTPFSSYSAENLKKALDAKFNGRWYVIAAENDEFYSVSTISVYKDYLDMTYKGVRWFIFSQ